MHKYFFILLLSGLYSLTAQNIPDSESQVFIDNSGVIRWTNTNKEVALFGANYCLPSACDFRAAKYYSNDLKAEINKDMTHFIRMGWDGLRVCLWGDFQNSDSLGNLVNNEHLDLMDYLIYEAKNRGIKMLLSPIVTYSSQWPDAMHIPATGFSTHFNKSELGTNPEAIRAQANYLRQLLNHVNPYTGNAIKNEPDILFIEMINEPWHHSNDTEGSVRYINALVDAVRSTGCKKIVFHNVSQDFNIAGALKLSEIQGASFAWYPSGLVSGRTLKGNFLRTVDNYELMNIPALDGMPRIVYEFDAPDLLSPVMYPAMVRTYRSVGSQFTAMFAYDMLVTAKANLGWQTHFLNLVYSPQKAAGAIIAAEAMRKLPLYKSYGNYPENTSFGPFRISYEKNLSEYITEESFMYSGNTESVVPNPGKLSKIVGFHSSPLVNYHGEGVYFLDKIQDGIWRLELYPDAILVKDPFAQMSPEKTVSRLIFKELEMEIDLPDLDKDFSITPNNENNQYSATAENGRFLIKPGVYTLVNKRIIDKISLPAYINSLGYNEYIVPEPEDLPLEVRHETYHKFQAGQPVSLSAMVVDEQPIDSVKLFIRKAGSWFRPFSMNQTSAYVYQASLSEDYMREGYYDYCITVYQGTGKTTFPSEIKKSPFEWDFYSMEFWSLEILPADNTFPLFIPKHDFHLLSFTRIGDNIRHGIFSIEPAQNSENGAIRLRLPREMDNALDDYTASLYIGDRLANIKDPENITSLVISVRGLNSGDEAFITLVESDGTSWTSKLKFENEWTDVEISLDNLAPGKGVMLPQGFPGNWNYWLLPPKGRGGDGDKINMTNVEHLQLSIRPASNQKNIDSGIEISSIGVRTQK